MKEEKEQLIWYDNQVIGTIKFDLEKRRFYIYITDPKLTKMLEELKERDKNISIGFDYNSKAHLKIEEYEKE